MLSLPLLFGVSVLTFVLAGLTPGSAARAILGTTATNQSIAALNRSLGLNKPIYQQYWHWLYGILHGQLGHSIFTGEPVSRILASGLPITLTLIGASVLLSLLIGVPLGVLSAQRSGGRGQLLDGLSMVGFAVPTFWLGLVLVLVFANWLHVLPATGWVYPSASLTGWLRSLALPVLTLSLGGSSVIAKQTRDGMLEALESEFIRSLRSRGIPEYSITYRHALRNALPNVVTLVGLYVVSLLLGTTLVESVFALQGLGSIAVQATEQHDLPIVEGAALYFTVIVIVAFALVDLVRAWLNPKLRTAN
jgi:peptide/nickel transport system permease protein